METRGEEQRIGPECGIPAGIAAVEGDRFPRGIDGVESDSRGGWECVPGPRIGESGKRGRKRPSTVTRGFQAAEGFPFFGGFQRAWEFQFREAGRSDEE